VLLLAFFDPVVLLPKDILPPLRAEKEEPLPALDVAVSVAAEEKGVATVPFLVLLLLPFGLLLLLGVPLVVVVIFVVEESERQRSFCLLATCRIRRMDDPKITWCIIVLQIQGLS